MSIIGTLTSIIPSFLTLCLNYDVAGTRGRVAVARSVKVYDNKQEMAQEQSRSSKDSLWLCCSPSKFLPSRVRRRFLIFQPQTEPRKRRKPCKASASVKTTPKEGGSRSDTDAKPSDKETAASVTDFVRAAELWVAGEQRQSA